MLEMLDRLCRYHHRLKTTKGWALVEGTGKRDFVPPEDPRHPRHAKGPKSRSARAGTCAPEDGSGGRPHDIGDGADGWSMPSGGTNAGAGAEGRDP